MTHPKPNITVKVDLTNPGQFFACCGLLELADRLWPKAEVTAAFTVPRFERSRFSIFSKCGFKAQTLIEALCNSTRTPVDPYVRIQKNGKEVKDPKKIKPVRLDLAGHDCGRQPVSIRLCWWLNEFAGEQLDDFKLWSAHPSSESLINDMANAIEPDEISDENVFEYSVGMSGRIGLDARSSWNALDEGFSPNNQNLEVETYPATELLAAVGLQNFVPVGKGNGYYYDCWSVHLPAIVAHAAVSGCISLPGATRYRFQIGKRGRFKCFTKALRIERNTND